MDPTENAEYLARAAEHGRRGADIRNERLSAERKHEIASQAASLRWAAQRFLGTYPRTRDNVTRVAWHMRSLSRLLDRAIVNEDWKEARQCIGTMLLGERLTIWIEMQAGRPGGPPLDVDANDEAAKRLLDARKQRNKALGLEGEQETIVDHNEKVP